MPATLSIADPWYDLVKTNKKIFEGRLNTADRKNIKIGDTICFTHAEKESFTKEVVDVHVFENFQEAFEWYFGPKRMIQKVLPGIDNVKDAVAVYAKFYTIEQQKQWGVVFFELKPII